MFSQNLPSASSAPSEFVEVMEGQQLAANFAQEVHYRQEFEAYCRWYAETAAVNQRSLQRMRREFNLFQWFIR